MHMTVDMKVFRQHFIDGGHRSTAHAQLPGSESLSKDAPSVSVTNLNICTLLAYYSPYHIRGMG
jgi:hypothetical protein